MPFVPHTEDDIRQMLEKIGETDVEALFDEIPSELRVTGKLDIPAGLSEMEISTLVQQRAKEDGRALCFIGAGAYEHHIPAAVWQIATRGEFYTAYTPYQAEASQGTLQLLYEFQSMMTALTAMDVANASLYDGASALAEAVLMAVRGNRKSRSRKILLPRSLHPEYRATVHTLVRNQHIELLELPFDSDTGQTRLQALDAYRGEDIAALVIPQPNFFGVLEDVDGFTEWAHANGALAIAVVNPLALAILEPPGNWGRQGVDICCGEGQPLGIPMSSGGPYFGFLCSTQKLVRQMPGRIVGRTRDLDGKQGFSLTLQAREQHIRRSKATSNICTNQGLMVTAATVHMAMLGADGLARAAAGSHANTRRLVEALTAIPGVRPLFSGAVFHERVLHLPMPVKDALKALAAHNVLGGYDLRQAYPELGEALLVCATELRTQAEIDQYRQKLERIVAARSQAQCPVQPKFDS